MRFIIAILIILSCTNSYAQNITSGTGFFVNRFGFILTNGHVVTNCKNIVVRGPKFTKPAALIGKDKVNDMAILRVDSKDNEFAKLAYIKELKESSLVVTIAGFPVISGFSPLFNLTETEIESLNGPLGEEGWIQLLNVARRGNSGGPVMDENGNVVGMILGKIKMENLSYNAGARPERAADVAINSNVIKNFLTKHNIPVSESPNTTGKEKKNLYDVAKSFAVNISCYNK